MKVSETELRQHRCCFTGHREQKLRRGAGLIRRELEKEIRKAVSEGFTTFITGMAYGVDIMRLFIAIQLNQKIKQLVSDVQDTFRWQQVKGNYTPEENLHITLAFIGEYGDPHEILELMQMSF